MTQKELIATHIRAAMASMEVVWALLDLDKAGGPTEEPPEDGVTKCGHPEESRTNFVSGGWGCTDCGHREGG